LYEAREKERRDISAQKKWADKKARIEIARNLMGSCLLMKLQWQQDCLAMKLRGLKKYDETEFLF
jgi:hypothetical protein